MKKSEKIKLPKLHSTTGEYNSYEEAIEDLVALNNLNTQAITKVAEHIVELKERIIVLENQLSELTNKE